MRLKNEFKPKTRAYFADQYECWYCGRNTWDALHHIVRRGLGNSECENSPLNAAPICNYPCHINNHGKITQDNYKKLFLQKTYDFLLNRRQYKLTGKDYIFMEKYSRYYSKSQLNRARKKFPELSIPRGSLVAKDKIKRYIPPVPHTVPKADENRNLPSQDTLLVPVEEESLRLDEPILHGETPGGLNGGEWNPN